jgi:hypothetical protein
MIAFFNHERILAVQSSDEPHVKLSATLELSKAALRVASVALGLIAFTSCSFLLLRALLAVVSWTCFEWSTMTSQLQELLEHPDTHKINFSLAMQQLAQSAPPLHRYAASWLS